MPSRKVFHVLPDRAAGWKVSERGGSKGSTFKRKTEAVSFARSTARRAPLGQVIVHGRNGKVQAEYTYGEDPRRYPG